MFTIEIELYNATNIKSEIILEQIDSQKAVLLANENHNVVSIRNEVFKDNELVIDLTVDKVSYRDNTIVVEITAEY